MEDRTLADALNDTEPNRYLCRGRYFMQLQQYLAHFREDQILLLTTRDLRDHRLRTLGRIFRFLGIDDGFDSTRFATVLHRTADYRRKNSVGVAIDRAFGAPLLRRLPPSLQWPAQMLLYYPFSSPVPRPTLPPLLRDRLTEYFRSDVEQLRAYSGLALEHWSV